MNIVRIQQDLIKDVLAGNGDKWFIQITATDAIIMTNCQIYLLDHKEYLLDTTMLINSGVKNIATAEKILDIADNAKPAIKTGLLKILNANGKNRTCVELKCEDNGELVYLDQTLLKYYDQKAEFEVVNAKSPVYVYESDLLVGVVMPVKSV